MFKKKIGGKKSKKHITHSHKVYSYHRSSHYTIYHACITYIYTMTTCTCMVISYAKLCSLFRHGGTNVHDISWFIASLNWKSFLPPLFFLAGKLSLYEFGASMCRSYFAPWSICGLQVTASYTSFFSLLCGDYVIFKPVSISSFSKGRAFTTLRFSSVFKEL